MKNIYKNYLNSNRKILKVNFKVYKVVFITLIIEFRYLEYLYLKYCKTILS